MAYNKDEMNAPKWMDGAFFEKVLQQSENDDSVKVTEFTTAPGSKPGDHFASIIFRAAVKFVGQGKSKDISLIVKTLPELEGIKKDLLEDGRLFETEATMYNIVLPEVHKMLRAVGDDTVLGPRLHYSSKDPVWVMVFDDLSKKDFVTKPTQLNLAEAKMFYAKLGRLHAASMCLAEKLPNIKKMDCNIGTAFRGDVTDLWVENISILARLCLEWPGYQSYFEQLEKFKKQIIEKMCGIYTCNKSSLYNVLNHGDCNYRNCMYRIVDGKTQDLMLLDYQLSSWGSPAVDIIYSLYQAVSVETRDNHRDELIKFYYDEFATALKKFDYGPKIPTLIDLRVEITRCGHLESFLSTTFLPMFLLTPDEMVPQMVESSDNDIEIDLASVKAWENLSDRCFRHPKYAEAIKRYLPTFWGKGLLDF
ncbi:uncharacterized protein LOC6043426 [Culex quinquefasciatus]|uniref:uncharacterized protein LOC6043426 n=1 Tax=Culex quinquefasciatus TaxID=7176 RepID=UPI0018E38B66|nr:uncharacterized protein LOC6043426 [Culex quinquefasciatus]